MNPLSSPKIDPPEKWNVPVNIEVRRVRNICGVVCLVFSDPEVVAAGIGRGWVGTVEDLFREENLPEIYVKIAATKK